MTFSGRTDFLEALAVGLLRVVGLVAPVAPAVAAVLAEVVVRLPVVRVGAEVQVSPVPPISFRLRQQLSL